MTRNTSSRQAVRSACCACTTADRRMRVSTAVGCKTNQHKPNYMSHVSRLLQNWEMSEYGDISHCGWRRYEIATSPLRGKANTCKKFYSRLLSKQMLLDNEICVEWGYFCRLSIDKISKALSLVKVITLNYQKINLPFFRSFVLFHSVGRTLG